MLSAFPHIISFNLYSNFARYYDHYFVDEQIKAQNLGNSPQVTLLVSAVTFLKTSLTRITLFLK